MEQSNSLNNNKKINFIII